ncbi:hypothetical protein [Streptomyces chartreusis]
MNALNTDLASAAAPTEEDGDVIVVGSVDDDLIVTVRRLRRPGRDDPGDRPAATARFAARTTHVARFGDDQPRQDALADLMANGAEIAAVTPSGCPTGTAVVRDDEHGETEIVVFVGVHNVLDSDTVRSSYGEPRQATRPYGSPETSTHVRCSPWPGKAQS